MSVRPSLLLSIFLPLALFYGSSHLIAQTRLGESNLGPVDPSSLLIFGFGAGSGIVDSSKFKRDLEGSPRFTPSSQWGYRRDITYCTAIIGNSSEEKSSAVRLILNNYLDNQKPRPKGTLVNSKCSIGVDIFVIDGVNYNSLLDQMREAVQKNNVEPYPWVRAILINRQYGLISNVGGETFAKFVDDLVLKSQNQAQAEQQDAADLIRFASSDSKEKVFLLQFGTLGARRMCALETSSDDALPIRALGKLVGEKRTAEGSRSAAPARFFSTYRTLDEFWNSFYFSSGRVLSSRGGEACDAFIDFAKNTKALADAFSAAGIPTRSTGYLSLPVTALALGFKSISDYNQARVIGAGSKQFYALGAYGISSYKSYQATAKEMQASGYSSSTSIDEVLSYLEDRREGTRSGTTAVRVRSNRERAEAAAERASEAAYARCLTTKGYYRTSNAAARRAIERQC